MSVIVGVKAEHENKLLFYDAADIDPAIGEKVIIETSKGIGIAEVISRIAAPSEPEVIESHDEAKNDDGTVQNENDEQSPETEESNSNVLLHVIRKATAEDIDHAEKNKEKEKEAFTICQKKIAEHKLEMKLVGVECMFDNSKILFYFTANGRVDFRSLVKDLASVFKTRIELRQIGVRDEAKMIGGLGPCGRQLCCGSFLNEFIPVSIKMAKEQNLSLNPTKISGVCGRLMCCLKYEQEHYEQTRKRMPKISREVETPDGTGTVSELNIVKETIKVRIGKGDDYEIKEYSLDDIREKGNQTKADTALPEDPDEITENTEDESETFTGIAENDDEGISLSETATAAESDTHSEKQKNTAAGQVVKRENKHRGVMKGADNTKRNPERKKKEETSGPAGRIRVTDVQSETNDKPKASDRQVPPARKVSPWQEALNKAMEQAEKQQ